MECGNPISHIRQTDIVERELGFKSSLEMRFFFLVDIYMKRDVYSKSEISKQNIYFVVRKIHSPCFAHPFTKNSPYIHLLYIYIKDIFSGWSIPISKRSFISEKLRAFRVVLPAYGIGSNMPFPR